jgi:hypothetical protein
MSVPVIGFIGLGIMGTPTTRNLLRAGYPLIVHDLNRTAVEAAVAAGATAAATPREIAQRSQGGITMLPDSPDAVCGDGGRGPRRQGHSGIITVLEDLAGVQTRTRT